MRVTTGTLAAGLLLTFCGMSMAAGSYPTRPIRMVVPFAPGGTASIISRAIANEAEKHLGQSFVVDNRDGANGIIGTQIVVNAAPDGYTMLHTTTSIAINPAVYKKLPYDTLKDLAPVTIVALGSGYVLLANQKLGVHTVKDLIALAKASDKPVTYGSAGIGNSTQLVAEMFSKAAGIHLSHVPYKGVAPALNAVIGGEVNIMFIPPTAAVGHIKAGRVTALAFTGKSRWSVLPDVPTVAESGGPEFVKDAGFNAWLVAAATPKSVIERLRQAAAKAVHEPKVKALLEAGGYEPLVDTPEEARAFLRSEIEIYSKIAREVGVEQQ
jgi:tripartite-type tricarboxylate transporter receptor subunit TctC